MANKPADAPEAKPKSKKLLIIILVVVLVLVLGGVGTAFFLMKSQSSDEDQADEPAAPKAAASKPNVPPQYMPLDPIVINLADPGVIRYAQIGITLQVDAAPTAEVIKSFLPTIRNGMLREIAKRTSAELLQPEGKDKLASDILELVRQETGLVGSARVESPVQAVLFASLIIQ